MRKIITFFVFLSTINSINSQIITASVMNIYHTNIAVVPVINAGKGPELTNRSFSFSYEQCLKNKRYSVILSYARFDGCTSIDFEPGGWVTTGGTISAIGFCSGLKVHRLDIGVLYNLFKKNKKFYLKPCAILGVQKSNKTAWEFWPESINGPNYFELEPMSAEAMNTTQIVPSIGVRTGFVFWKRLDVGLGFQGVYGFKPYQKMYLKYQYKGVVQPTAEYESTGTGLFVTLGIGYRFARWIKG
jgi:hypothetical protein